MECYLVVPRKGDVDRNTVHARKAVDEKVVPRKGDVDRNRLHLLETFDAISRPPQGGRG